MDRVKNPPELDACCLTCQQLSVREFMAHLDQCISALEAASESYSRICMQQPPKPDDARAVEERVERVRAELDALGLTVFSQAECCRGVQRGKFRLISPAEWQS